jgi:hypothetical protein
MNSDKGKMANLLLIFLVSISVFGLLLSNFFVFNPSMPEEDFAYRDQTIGTIFGLACTLGILAALFPSSCLAIPQVWKNNRNHRHQSNMHKENWGAHHPSCENYITHVLSIGNLKICATCYGLMVGAIFALISTSLYFFGGLSIGNPVILVLVGTTGVTLGLLQSGLPKFSNSVIRFFGSISFVMGTSLMLISIDAATNSFSIDLFFIMLSILWILTKIKLSQRDHRLTCSNCSTKSCRNNKKGIR